VKALSVKQPWAELIARAADVLQLQLPPGRAWWWKDLEIRTWPTDYRGPLAIVSSGRADVDGWDLVEPVPEEGLVLGATVALVELSDCIQVASLPPAEVERRACWPAPPDAYAFVFTKARRLKPQPVSGRLRIYEIPDNLVQLA